MFGTTAAPARQHTTHPIVTGTSVLGLVYDGGVLLAADTLLSYGSMAKAQNVQRLRIIPGTHSVLRCPSLGTNLDRRGFAGNHHVCHGLVV
jgi:hypothetical protein